MDSETWQWYGVAQERALERPFASWGVAAGFPSPAQDYMDLTLDLNKELVRNPNATFYARVKGDSMLEAGLNDGDVLIIDRSLEPREGRIAVCYLDGQFTVKRLHWIGRRLFLMPANSDFDPIEVTPENEFMVWGVVTYVIKKV